MAAVEQFANNAITTLTLPISASQTSITVSSNDGFPAVTTASTNFFYVTIGSEILKVTDNSSLLWIVVRGNQSTIAQSHAALEIVYCTVTKQSMIDIQTTAASAAGTLGGTYATMPAAGVTGRLYFPTDSVYIFRDNGVTWDPFWHGRQVNLPPAFSGLTLNLSSGVSGNNTYGYMQIDRTGGKTINQQSSAVKTLNASSNYTFEIGFEATQPSAVNGFGLCMRNSGTGASIHFQQRFNPTMQTFVYKWTNDTTFSATYLQADTLVRGGPQFMRVVDDNVNRKFYIGANLQQMILFFSVGRTDFTTPDQIGVSYTSDSALANSMQFTHWKEY